MYTLLKSLRLCASASTSGSGSSGGKRIAQASLGTSNNIQTELIEAIDRYEHIIVTSVVEKDDCYQFGCGGSMKETKDTKDSRVLTEFPHCLEDLVGWIWEHGVAFPEAYFRRCCMKAFASLCPLLSSSNTNNSNNSSNSNNASAVRVFVMDRLEGAGGVGGVGGGGSWGDFLAMTGLPTSSPASLINEVQCEEVWLLSLDAFVDTCNWLIRKQYVDVNWVCVLSSDGPSPTVVSVDESATTTKSNKPSGNKKRKAGVDVEIAIDSKRTKSSSVIGDSLLREALCFVSYCCASVGICAPSTFSKRFRHVNVAKLQVLRSEVVSRLLQLLCSIFEVNKQSASVCVPFIEQIWTEHFSMLVSNLLLHPCISQTYTGSSTHLPVPFFLNSLEGQQSSILIPQHIHKLLKFSATCSNPKNSASASILLPEPLLKSFYSFLADICLNTLDEVIALQVQAEDITCCEDVYMCIRAESYVWDLFGKALCVEIVSRGGDESIESVPSVEIQLQEYAHLILKSVVQYSENCSASDVEIGSVAIHLSFIMGLPFVPPTETPNANAMTTDKHFESSQNTEAWLKDKPCVLQVSLDSENEKCVDLFLDRYSSILVEGLTTKIATGTRVGTDTDIGTDMGCVFAFTTCVPLFFSLYRYYRSQQGSESVHRYLVLSRVISRVLSHILTSITVKDDADSGLSVLVGGVMNSCDACGGDIFDFSNEMIVQLLELDASIDNLKLRNTQLYTCIAMKCITILSDATATTDDIVSHLRYLPYILPGVISTCRLRYSQVINQGGILSTTTSSISSSSTASSSNKELFNCFNNQPIDKVYYMASISFYIVYCILYIVTVY